jgi:hypothetical protein
MLGISDIGIAVSSATEVAKKILAGLKSTFGHYLHHFLDQAHLEDANARWVAEMKLKYTGKEKDTKDYQAKQDGSFRSVTTAAKSIADSQGYSLGAKINDIGVEELADQELYTLLIQIVESVTIKQDNAATDDKLKDRWNEMETRIKNAEHEDKYEQARRNAKQGVASTESPETTKALLKAIGEAPQAAVGLLKEKLGQLVLDDVVRDEVIKHIDEDAFIATVICNADKKVTTAVSFVAEANNIQNSGEAKQVLAATKSSTKSGGSAYDKFSSGNWGSASKNAVTSNLGGSLSSNSTMGRNSADATAVKK